MVATCGLMAVCTKDILETILSKKFIKIEMEKAGLYIRMVSR